MQDATSPTRRRWFQFTLRDCLIASLAVAATIAPLKLYERFNPPAKQVRLSTVIYQADAEKLRELAGDWSESQFRADSKAEAKKVADRLAEISAKVITSPTIMTIDGQMGRVSTGASIPIVDPDGQNGKSVKMLDVGIALSATPTILPNGRVRLDMAWQHSRLAKEFQFASEIAPVSFVDADKSSSVIESQGMSFVTELAPQETMFFFDASGGLNGEGIMVEVRLGRVN